MPYVAVNKDGLYWSSFGGFQWDEVTQRHLSAKVDGADELNPDLRIAWNEDLLRYIEQGIFKLVPDPRLTFVGISASGSAVYENLEGEKLSKEHLFDVAIDNGDDSGEDDNFVMVL